MRRNLCWRLINKHISFLYLQEKCTNEGLEPIKFQKRFGFSKINITLRSRKGEKIKVLKFIRNLSPN